MPTASSAWPERLLSESQDAVALQWRLRSVAFTYDWSWWYPSGNRPLQYILVNCRALVMVSSWLLLLTAWLQNSAWANLFREGIDGRVTAIIARLSASSPAQQGLLTATVITPLPTKPSATKMPENWSWRTRQLLTCRCVSVMLLRSMQNTRRSVWC